MLSQIKESEIEFMGFYSDPTALTECLVPENPNSPQTWPNCKTLTLRDYQFAMQNYSYLIALDPALSQLENFKLKKASGDLYSIGSRNTGKSLWLIIDVALSFIHKCKEGCVASVTAEKLEKVTVPICRFIEAHKFLKIFHLKQETTRSKTVKKNPLTVASEHGAIILSVNEKIDSDTPGVQFCGKHYDIRWTEEISYSTKQGQEWAEDAEMSYGHIERPSGIPDLHVDSALDKILKDKQLKNWIWRLPQYVREDWTPEVEERKAKKYNGRSSAGYKLNVEAETLEGAFNFFDMARLKESSFYKTGRIKTFEIGRETYQGFENRLHIERMAGSEQIYVCFDDDTEILTENGWKLFKNVRKNEKVLSWDYNNNITKYLPFQEYIEQNYDGEMINYNAENLQFSVTPNHKMLVNRHTNKKGWHFIDAENIVDNLLIKRDITNIQKDFYDDTKKFFEFKKRYKSFYNFSIEDWAEFLGWYISEGCLINNQNWRICISQQIQKNRESIKQLLDRMKINYYDTGKDFYIHSKPIYQWLKKHCYEINTESKIKKTTYYNCYNKTTPNFLRKCSSKIINIFLDSFISGDGWRTTQNRVAMRTSSKKLAGDLQELILLSGQIATISKHEKSLRDFGKHISLCQENYTIYIWKRNHESKLRKKNITKTHYKGKIYCVNVNPYHSIYVRKNGKGFWCGNCADIGTGSAPTEIIIVFFDGKVFKYAYNISLHRLIQEEQAEIFYWIFNKLEGAFIAIDATHDGGVIIDMLRKKGIDEDCLLKVKFNENIDVDLEKDKETNEPLMDDNNDPIMIQANTEFWSYSELEKLLYSGEFKTSPDAKFEDQFSNIICKRSKSKTLFDSKGPNHLVQAFQVFAICKFFNEFNILKRQYKKVKRAYCSFTKKEKQL